MKPSISLTLSEEYAELIDQRCDQIRNENADRLDSLGRDELAEQVRNADSADRAEYVKRLVEADLKDAGLLPDGE